MGVREARLDAADYGEGQRKEQVAPWKPGSERGDEEHDLKPLHDETGGSVRVERALAGAEDVGADQVDLDEDAEHDRQREGEMQPTRASSDRVERRASPRATLGRKFDRSGRVGHASCSRAVSADVSGAGVDSLYIALPSATRQSP